MKEIRKRNSSTEKTSTVEFVVDKTGSFRYYCNVPYGSGHKSMGGNLVVE